MIVLNNAKYKKIKKLAEDKISQWGFWGNVAEPIRWSCPDSQLADTERNKRLIHRHRNKLSSGQVPNKDEEMPQSSMRKIVWFAPISTRLGGSDNRNMLSKRIYQVGVPCSKCALYPCSTCEDNLCTGGGARDEIFN
ncbi:unnamed protein product [Dracunculus medinensis]|uniref:ARF7EP_C domain-containing protein n=1 Tax=Dracunculus medinensis TaxID=318479 RepID=A0A0N4UES6_DRAME|nr:unnamed protein product [Dracunculus medinensis]